MKFYTETEAYRGPEIWNLIPDNVKNAPSLEIFKKEIKKSEAIVWRCSVEKLFLKFHRIHRKTPVPDSFF